jgi:hypothetical protein
MGAARKGAVRKSNDDYGNVRGEDGSRNLGIRERITQKFVLNKL